MRNDAARKTKGDWLCFVDADDEVDLGYLDAMHLAIVRQKKPERCLFTPAVSYVRKGKPAPPIFLDRGISLEHDNWLVVGTVVHRDLFFEVGGFSDYPHGFEDWSLWAKCWKAGAEIVKIPDAIYRAHVNPQSKHRKQWRNRKWQVEMHQRVQKELFST